MDKKKIIYWGVGIIVFGLIIFYFTGNHQTKTGHRVAGERTLGQTYKFSVEYLKLRYDTDKILTQASQYQSYDEWNSEMTTLLHRWQQMADHADFLGKAATTYMNSVSYLDKIKLVNIARAYSRQEISNVFDKAPAGKKIRTLAKFLGVDAKRAYKILQNDQEMVKADAWNQAGDTFQKLETSAVVIKDGCKVAGFVGGVVLSGGTAGFAGASTLTQASLIVNGTDLVLEVSDDSATIALGNNNKVSAMIGKVRTLAEPAAAILSISDMPGNLSSKFDKFGAVMFGADQLRSVAQEGKLIGIDISSNGSITAMALTKDEAKDWLKDKGGDKIPDDAQKIFDALDKINDEPQINKTKKETKAKTEDNIIKESPSQDEIEASEYYGAKKAYGKNGKTYVIISKSNSATFEQGQTQEWQAEIKNYDAQKQGRPICYWKFFVNGKQVWRQDKTCHFTAGVSPSTNGQLRAEVTVKFTKTHYEFIDGESKKITEIPETIVAERFYEVIPIPQDTHRYGE